MFFLQLEHVEDDDFDYIKFPDFATAITYLNRELLIYGGQRWVLSNEPVGLPESEYSLPEEL